MTKDDYIRLYEKYQAGHCTPAETELLQSYQDEFALEEHAWEDGTMGNKEEKGRELYQAIAARAGEERRRSARIYRMGGLVGAAALLLILAGVYLLPRRPVETAAPTLAVRFRNDISPGGNKARLTLANGSVITLDSVNSGFVAQQGSSKIIKTSSGQLSYVSKVKDGEAVGFNIISTPRGGQYMVLLPDGSKVWLNASSSLRFPTVFSGGERRVEVTGEAYFDVAKDSRRPFTVAVIAGGKNMEVEVLGTEFDVMAYEEEGMVSTTLLDGSIRLKKQDQSWLLKPAQQAVLQNNEMKVAADVDTMAVTAWKNGRFELNGNIKGIMRQIARWYDVDVQYEGNVSDRSFGGAISRTANVSEVLKILELTGSIHFGIDGRKITVTP